MPWDSDGTDNPCHAMDTFAPSDLKTILHSKRANIYYIRHCRVTLLRDCRTGSSESRYITTAQDTIPVGIQ